MRRLELGRVAMWIAIGWIVLSVANCRMHEITITHETKTHQSHQIKP